MVAFITTLYIIGLVLTTSCGHRPLNEFIKHFEPLNYRPKPRVTKRWTHDSQSLVIKAFGRKMYLDLHRDSISLASDVHVVDGSNRRIGFARHSFVTGRLKGEDGSVVYGVLMSSGVFTGRIATRDGTYFVEPAQRYFDGTVKFHSVIYRDRDVRHHSQNTTLPRRKTRGARQRDKNMLSRTRSRRSVKYHSNICRMSLKADHTFLKMAGGHVYAIEMMIHHIQALNAIFRYTFNTTDTYASNSKSPRGIQFQIARIKVYVNELDTVLARENIDAAAFLTLMDEDNDYSEYCEALFFTFRCFPGGVTGLAHTGGACTESNTAVVTFRRGNMRLPLKVTEIAVAHQMGHALGAERDPDTDECQPNGKDGNYIMKSGGTNGDRHNNAIFSPCSVKQMQRFLDNSRSENSCFRESSQSTEDRRVLCGNGVVDAGENINPNDREECDCGDEKGCENMEPGNCCNFKTCKLNKHAVCSLSNGFCCNATTCTYKEVGEVCMPELECSEAVTCQGNTSSCPAIPPKPNFLECNRNSSLCMNGSCSLSVCVKFGLEPCFCKKKEDQCKICCLHEGKCQAAKNITKMQSEIKSIYLNSGSLCLDNKGFCDVFHDCRTIDTRGFYNHYLTKDGVKEVTHRFWWAILLGTVGLVGGVFLIIKYGAIYTVSSNPLLNETEPARKLSWKRFSRSKSEEQREMITIEDTSS